MKLTSPSLLLTVITSLLMPLGGGAARPSVSGQEAQTAENKLVYADFETVQGDRPVSSRGGFMQLIAYQESPARPSRVKGAAQANPPAPELVRLQKESPNRAAAFDYELQGPNEYASAGLEIRGQADQDGKPVADDVSGYKYLSLQIFAKDTPSLRLEFTSQGQGVNIKGSPPQITFRVKPGFNTYRIPLGSLAQPPWVEDKVNPKEVLKKLTGVSLFAYCGKCTPIAGTVVVDNLVFEK